jgi:hypothetical protein
VTPERLDEEFSRIQQFLVRSKPSLLVVEDDEVQRRRIVELIGAADLDITAVDSGEKALAALKAGPFRLRGAGPDAARHRRLRRCSTRSARTRTCAARLSSSTPRAT